MNPKAELIRLEYYLGLSQETSRILMKLQKKTKDDIKKILWECGVQMKLINDFSLTEAHHYLNGDQRYVLNRHYIEAETTYYELSKK